MRIAIDMQTTLAQKTGFGFYVQNLVDNLEEIDKSNQYIKLLPDKSDDLKSTQRWWWDQIAVPKLAKKQGADLLHQPAFSAPIFFKGPVVVTVHDLIAIYFGKDIPLGSRLYFGKWMPFSYKFADHIIAISEHTKKDVMRLLKVSEEKITVIYSAADEVFRPINDQKRVIAIKNKYQTGDQFILHIGTLNPRKNLEFLIRAFAEANRQSRAAWKLVITGKKGWYYEGLFAAVEELGLRDRVVFTGYIDEEDKPLLYNAASIFAFPSLYEGAGLPPLEAMRCGTPVISSNTSSLPEMIGKGGILISPYNLDDWVRSLVRLMKNEVEREKLVQKGLRQAQKFSWRKTAQETIKVYEKVWKDYRMNKA